MTLHTQLFVIPDIYFIWKHVLVEISIFPNALPDTTLICSNNPLNFAWGERNSRVRFELYKDAMYYTRNDGKHSSGYYTSS